MAGCGRFAQPARIFSGITLFTICDHSNYDHIINSTRYHLEHSMVRRSIPISAVSGATHMPPASRCLPVTQRQVSSRGHLESSK